MTKIFMIPFFGLFVRILSSIIQIVVTCAFSVQACVLRCTSQIDKKRAVKFSICFFVSSRRVNIFGVLIVFIPSVWIAGQQAAGTWNYSKSSMNVVKGIALKFYFLIWQILFRVYLCTGKSAPYLLSFDDFDHHFEVVVLFFTFLKHFF